MTHARTPFWVTLKQFKELNAAIIPAVQAGDSQAQAIHEELSIARTRYSASRVRGPLLARALGHNGESFPIRLSEGERAYLLTLPLGELLRGELA